MSQKKITKLTPEQEALIPVYRDKWRKIALSTERIHREKAIESVKEAYVLIKKNEPEIIFFDSLYIGLDFVIFNVWQNKLGGNLSSKLWNILVFKIKEHLCLQIEPQLGRNFWEHLYSLLDSELSQQLLNQLEAQLWNDMGGQVSFHGYIKSENLAIYNILIECFICELNCNCEQRTWKAIQSLVKNCGWIFPFENICIVCDRPSLLLFDNQNRLHAEAEPAIQFTDGYSLYAYHGVTLPEKYGKLHPHEWQAKWLLEEDNAELRRVLIQGIGYTRIIQQLQATELDSYQEYTLLKIDNNIDIEPIYLL